MNSINRSICFHNNKCISIFHSHFSNSQASLTPPIYRYQQLTCIISVHIDTELNEIICANPFFHFDTSQLIIVHEVTYTNNLVHLLLCNYQFHPCCYDSFALSCLLIFWNCKFVILPDIFKYNQNIYCEISILLSNIFKHNQT